MLASISNSLEIEFDANPIETIEFPKSENALTKLSSAIFVEELGYVVVWS